jgi:hypothetical protein
MSVRGHHVAVDRLTVLALVSRAPDAALDGDDQDALAHVTTCATCAGRLRQLTDDADGLREAAFAEADAVFDEPRLESQRVRILDRLAHLGQSARVLRFPGRIREAAMPVPSTNRRWVTAAAAGLIIGLVTGQLLHLAPAEPGAAREQVSAAFRNPLQPWAPERTSFAPSAEPTISDDDLLVAVDASVQLRRARSLRALDALTPSPADLRDPLGR